MGRLDRPALRNHLPDFLAELGRCLEADHRTKRLADLAAQHGAHRLSRGVELRHVTVEYGLLRRVILEAYAGACGPRLDVREVRCLDDAIDDALSDAVGKFVRLREQTREQFVDILGHDLRTPLGAIQASAEYLRETVTDETQRDAVARIERSGDRIARMIDALLDLARTRLGGGIPVTPQPASMETLARAVADELRASSPNRRIVIETSGDLSGRWDRDRVAQAFSNVMSNAIVHGEDPIRVVLRGEDPRCVVVEITNAGEPISEDELPTLFEPYVGHGKGRETRSGPAGLGLGLFIACEIVAAHGGTIRAESSREAGTTFTMTWPRMPPGGAS